MSTDKPSHQVKVEEVKVDDVGALALTYTGSAGEVLDPDGPEAREVLRKIDWHILPVIMVASVIQFLDKTSVSHAALWGMNKEANLSGNQFPWLTTIFYMGYLLSEFPTNYLFQKIHLTRVCGVCIVLWGLVLMSTALAKDFTGLMAARFCLGVLEASISPCMALLTTMFYRRSEQPLRSSLWWSMNSMGFAFGGLVGYAIGHIHSSVPSWKFPFIILGAVTVIWGFVWLWLVPANPTEARWLSPREKAVAVLRLVDNETGIDNKKLKMYQVREAFTDVNFWLLNVLNVITLIPAGGVAGFGPLIIAGFGYSQLQSTLLIMPAGFYGVVVTVLAGWVCTRFRGMRHIALMASSIPGVVGTIMLIVFPDDNRVGLLMGFYVQNCIGVTILQVFGLVQANVAGRTKKNIYMSAVFVTYCIGWMIGPQLFLEREKPRYLTAFRTQLGCFCLQIVISGFLYFWNKRENAKRDRLAADGPASSDGGNVTRGLSDLTDRENRHFRYEL